LSLNLSILKTNWFSVFLVSLFALYFIALNVNHRFELRDFEVYFTASKHFFAGEQVYGRYYGLTSGFYKYSPFALFVFLPFTFFTLKIAIVLYFILLSFLIVYGFHFLLKFIKSYLNLNSIPDTKNTILFISSFVMLVHLQRELELGNVNWILMLCLTVSLKLLLDKKHISAGIIISLCILLKPHFIIILPLLFLHKKWKTLFVVFISLVSGFLFPILIVGFNQNLVLHTEWINTMASHNSTQNLVEGYTTIQAIIYHLFLSHFLINVGSIYNLIVIGFVAVGILGLFLFHFQKEKSRNLEMGKNLTIEFFILIALVPNLTLTDTEHFLYSAPLIIFLVPQLFLISKYRIMFWFICTSLFFYGGNWHDLWGHQLFILFSKLGLLGIGNLMIIVASIIVYNQNKLFQVPD